MIPARNIAEWSVAHPWPTSLQIEQDLLLSPALPLARLPFTVTSSWWTGEAQVPTFQAPELVATKI
jgi:hypothetical protein